MNILMKKFKRMAIRPHQEASMLVRIAADSAFNVFTDEQFRKSIDFDKEKQEEQDRIWNELAVTGLLFLLAFLDDYLKADDSERRPFWVEVRNAIIPGFTKWYFYELSTEKITEEPREIANLIRSQPDTPRHRSMEEKTLSEIRGKIDNHIKNTYLKQVQAPIGVRPILKAWIELS